MPHHPLALFSLLPLNPLATQVVQNPLNRAFIGTTGQDRPIEVLDVGHIHSQTPGTLVTLG